MYDLDHMLNGKGSSQHHQELIQQAKYAQQDHIKPSGEKRKVASPLRAVFAAVMHIIWSI